MVLQNGEDYFAVSGYLAELSGRGGVNLCHGGSRPG